MANAEGDSTENVCLIFLSIRLRKSLINRMIYASRRLYTYKKSSEWTAANSRKSMSFGYGSDKLQRGPVRV